MSSSDWLVVILHTHPKSLLRDAFEAAFPDGRVASLHFPSLRKGRDWYPSGEEMATWFSRHVFDPGIWSNRVLTIYESGEYHHFTYGLSHLAARRRGLIYPRRQNFTYCHFDNHRDDYDFDLRKENGYSPWITFANFVDSLSHDHGAVPFLIGPDIYPEHDYFGYNIKGFHIPIFSNYFTGPVRKKIIKEKKNFKYRAVPGNSGLASRFAGTEMPSTRDLQETPTDAYLSFDLDVLSPTEIVTNFDQNSCMTLRRLLQITNKVQAHKRVFGADILGLPYEYQHPLSVLGIIILARKIMGMGTNRLLVHHAAAKRLQSLAQTRCPKLLEDNNRKSPLSREELLEVVRG